MTNAIMPRQQRQRPVSGQAHSAGMTACRVAGVALGVLVLGIVLSQVPDVIRYVRMSQM